MSAGTAHRLGLLQKWESHLTPPQLEVWRRLMELLPKDSALVGERGGYGLECALMGYVKRGAQVEDVRRLIPHGEHRMYDRKAAAAGDAS